MRPGCLTLCVVFVAAGIGVPMSKDGTYVFPGPERTKEAIDKVYAAMPPVRYTPPADRWQHLPRTVAALGQDGGTLKILMLGDSIVNDTSRSSFELLLQDAYPKCRIRKTVCVRGSTGCWWYREPERLEKYVLAPRPDLIVLGGISHRDDIDSIVAVLRGVRAKHPADFLVLAPAFGTVDPRDDKQWAEKLDPAGKDFRARLARMAASERVGFLDMTAAWGRAVRDSGKPIDWFKRDVVHANERGEQVLGRILAAHLAPPLPPSRR